MKLVQHFPSVTLYDLTLTYNVYTYMVPPYSLRDILTKFWFAISVTDSVNSDDFGP